MRSKGFLFSMTIWMIFLVGIGVVSVRAAGQDTQEALTAGIEHPRLAGNLPMQCPSAISYDQLVDCSISSPGEQDTFTFAGVAGERISARVLETSNNNFQPKVQVNRPGGTFLCAGSVDQFIQIECTLDATGTFSIIVSDNAGDKTGDYSMYLQRLNNPVNATTVAYDQQWTGTIDSPPKTQAYTFSGATGERVILRMLDTGSTLFIPEFRIYRPDGTWLCGTTGDPFTEEECTLDATGTFAIFATDNGGDLTGSYSMYLQRLNNPVNASAVAYDQQWTGTINMPLQMKAFTFSGIAGERVDVRMLDTSGTQYTPEFHIYRPDGTWLCGTTGNPFTEVECTLNASGTFAILTTDNGGDLTGSYSMYLQRLNNPVNAAMVAYDQQWSGSIDSPPETQAYTFNGAAGERVILRIMDTSGTQYAPEFRVYRPDGTWLCGTTGDPFNETECTLDATGTFAIFAMDNGGDLTGSYSMYLQRLTDPVNATAVAYDQQWTGSIDIPLGTQAYTFNGASGERVTVRMLDTSGTQFTPEFRVYRPNGTWLCGSTGNPFTETECTLNANGTFVILTTDNGGDLTGSYSMYLQRLNNPVGCTAIAFGSQLADSIDSPPELDCFSFGGLNGDQVRITMMDTSGTSFVPDVSLYRPDGTWLCGAGSDPSASIDCNLDASGGYAIFAGDNGADLTGSYTLSLNCLSGTCGFAVPTITSVLPNQGLSDIPNEINIYGSGFQSGAAASLGSTNLSTTFVSASQLRAVVPAGLAPGAYTVAVTNPDEGFASLPNGYTVLDATSPDLDDLFGYDYELWVDPLTPRSGDQATLGLVVHREGGKNTLANVQVRFYLGDPQAGGTEIGTGTIPNLSPRTSASTTGVPWTAPAEGSYTIYAVIDPDDHVVESNENNNVIFRTVTVLAQGGDQVAPHVDSFAIDDGADETSSQDVTLDTTVSDPAPSSGVSSLMFVEFEYSLAAGLWYPVQISDWLPYATSNTNYPWTLLPFSGMHYLQAWAADGAGNISLFPYLDYINYNTGGAGGSSESVTRGLSRVYRYDFAAGRQVDISVTPASGDPDLYVWAPDSETRPPWVSNLSSGMEQVSFVAPVSGTYQVEVYGYTDAEFTLAVQSTSIASNPGRPAAGGISADKVPPSQPVIPLDSLPGDKFAPPSAPVGETTGSMLYLPLVRMGN